MNPLKEYLSRAGLTQAKFAERIGVRQSMVSRLIAGEVRPGLDTAVAIERETGGAVPVKCWADSGEAAA